jgi:hypothetical protein
VTDAPAAFSATFCGMRTVASRKVAQITMEVPIEQMATVLATLGPPSGVDPQWVAIALLDKKAAAQSQGAQAPVPSKSSPVNTREKRSFRELPYSQQAALKCEDRAFRRFLEETHRSVYGATDGNAAEIVRYICKVKSRSEFDADPEAAGRWEELRDRFDAWMRAA